MSEKQKTIRQEINELNGEAAKIRSSIESLNKIEITVKNGAEKHITYKRNEFFQMLFDRKNVWRDKARVTAKDIALFLGVGILIVDRILGIL